MLLSSYKRYQLVQTSMVTRVYSSGHFLLQRICFILSFTKLGRPLIFLYNGLSREVKAVAKLEEGGAYGVIIIDNQKPNERSSLSVRVGRFTINAGFRYLYRGLNCIDC